MVFAPHVHPSFLRRLSGWLGVALVLTLNVLAVRPDLHAALHAEHDAHAGAKCSHHHHTPVESAEHDCVVNAFAHGHAETGVTPVVLAGPRLDSVATLLPEVAAAILAPEHRLPPGCGPPAV